MDKTYDQLQIQLEEEELKYDLLQKVSFELTKLAPLTERLNNILEFLDTSFNLNHTILLIPDKNHANLQVLASRGFKQPGIGAEIPINYGVVGTVATKKKKMRVSRLSQYRKYVNAGNQNDNDRNIPSDFPKLEHAESQVAFPLVVNNELVAVLSCESENILFFSQKEENLLMTLSQQIAISIQNSLIYNELDDRVKRRTEELETINKTKDHLFSIIAHDLRSPLSALEGIAELFEYYGKKEAFDKMLLLGQKVSSTSQQVSQLLDNLLNWSLSQQQGIKYNPTLFELSSLLKEVQILFKGLLESKKISLHVAPCDHFSIYADYTMSFSIFRNLLSNAIKFTHNNGQININATKEGDMLRTTIRDNGIGMDNDTMKKLFSLEQGVSRPGTNHEKGTGLGLLLVKEFIKENKGSIQIESSAKGTAIHVFLPTS